MTVAKTHNTAGGDAGVAAQAIRGTLRNFGPGPLMAVLEAETKPGGVLYEQRQDLTASIERILRRDEPDWAKPSLPPITEITRYAVNDGDYLFFSVRDGVPNEVAMELGDMMEAEFPTAKVYVLCNGVRLVGAIASPEQ